MTTEWTDDLKAQVIEDYKDREPTPDTSVEIVKELATEYETSPNRIRTILTTAGVYIKKAATESSKSSGTSGTGTKRVSKADAIAELKAAITEKGGSLDDDILDKLTGKAAQYFTTILKG